VNVPRAILVEIERVGRLILAGELSYDEAIDALEPLLDKDEHRLFVRYLNRRYLRKQIKAWMNSHLATAAEDDESGQGTLPYPDLPAHIEIAPGLFKHQNAMNDIKDWDAALVQAEVKAANASGHVERVRRAREHWIRQQEAGEEKGA
jgi:hypothetical protein